MGSKAAKEATKIAENYRKALQFLEGLQSCTYDDFVKSIKIAKIEMEIPCPESLRQIQIDALRKGIEVLEEVANKLGD